MRPIARLVVVLAGVVLMLAGLYWWQQRPPSTLSHWNNHIAERGINDPEVPHFLVGGFAFDWDFDGRDFNEEVTVAYLVRIEQLDRLRNSVPLWLEERDGGIYVEGRRVQPRRGQTQLFLDDGGGQPKRVVLTDPEARRAFQDSTAHFASYKDCLSYWEDVVVRRYLPEAE